MIMSDTEVTLVPITGTAAYTELYAHADGTYGAHVEDSEGAVEPHWTRAQAERFHAALSHLLWPQEWEYSDEDGDDEE
jgi:hypothetical protein